MNNGFEGRFNLPSDIVKTFHRTDRSDECFNKTGVHTREDWLCVLGSQGEISRFVVFGDSHALALLPAFDEAAKQNRIAGAFTGVIACLPFLGIYTLDGNQDSKDCHLLNLRVYNYVKNNNIKKVFLIARWTYYTDGGYDGIDFSFVALNKKSKANKELSRDAFRVGLQNTIDSYSSLGAQLVIISQVPQQTYDPKNVYYRVYEGNIENHTENIRRLSISLRQHEKLQLFVESLFRKYQNNNFIRFLNLDDVYCDGDKCPIGNERQSYYFDDDHLSTIGARLAIDKIAKQLVH
jgi:hypothetical protein